MAKRMMIQGTASSVGKSLLVTALCRIFYQEGYRVAPFKSQNMASNTFVTKAGQEIARSQAVQAAACGMEPTYQINPIVLKPTGPKQSQLIINGEVVGFMSAQDYHEQKPALRKVVKEAYDQLSKDYDVIVIEGAGSPAEINLREHDLVNMGLAELVDAPVILVGDISLGGVFAALYGTLMLLSPGEQARIKGFIINKFIGDPLLLQPGIDLIQERMAKPCLGVLPYLEAKDLDYDRLADAIRGNIDLDKMKQIMGL
ncbi:MAG: cobyric acid synthase [Limnochordia bacterium]|nr:cobyric acid synthase [Limnochordia bacterium]